MAELFDAEGNPVEAFTEEEVSEKIEKAKEEAKTELETEKTEALDALKEEHTKTEEELQGKIVELEEEMEKVGKKDYNWERLRKSKEELETSLKKEREETDKKIEAVRTEIRGSKVDNTIRELVGTDQELFDKVKYHFGLFGGESKDEDEFKKRIDNAYLLATGEKPKSPLFTGVARTGGGKPPLTPTGEGKITEGGREVAKKMGITDEELKKRGHV